MCLEGASRAGAGLLESIRDDDLRAFYAWVPMLPPDDLPAAKRAAARFAEPRAAHYWDHEPALSRRMGQALRIGPGESIPAGDGAGYAWDVYLAYGPAAKELERPDFWMHQLGTKHAPELDANEWMRQVEAFIGTDP